MQNGDNDRPFCIQPDDVVMITTLDPDAVRQTVKRLRPCGITQGVTALLDPLEIRLGLAEAPCLVGMSPDVAQILFGGNLEVIGRHGAGYSPACLWASRRMSAIDLVENSLRRACSIRGFRKSAKAATASSSLISSRAGASPRVHFST